MSMGRASIRLRLTAWYGLLLAVTIAGLGLAVDVLTARSLLARVDAMLDFEFQEAAERLASGREVDLLADVPTAFHETYLMRILGPGGTILAQSPSLSGRAIPTPPQSEAAGRPSGHLSLDLGPLGTCRVATGAVGTGEGRRVVQIATSLKTHDGELAELRGVLLTILPPGVLVATVGGYWLAGRALAPVQRMAEAARHISSANLGDRIAVANADDELGRLAATLNAMLDRIDRAFAEMRRFTADAAHELRTPLASIRAEAEVALLAPRTDDEYRETLRSVVEEAERLSRLAERLLLLSREDSGEALPWKTFRLDEAVRSAAGDVAAAASRAGITVRVEGLPAVEVEGDRDLVRLVFDNLLDNAVKYSAAGGIVTVGGRRDDGLAIVEVSDTGVGIPEHALPRVFDRFYRVDASRSRRTGGVGLGLSIARAVVGRHGGTIKVTSELGRGSTFRVSLPTSPGKPRII